MKWKNLGSVDEFLHVVYKGKYESLCVWGNLDREGTLIPRAADSDSVHEDVSKPHWLTVICSNGPTVDNSLGVYTFLTATLGHHHGGQLVALARDLPLFHRLYTAAVGNFVLAPDTVVQLSNANGCRTFAHVVVEGVCAVLVAVVGQTDEVGIGLWFT